MTITKDTKDLAFRIKTDPASPPGDSKNLFCQVVITRNGEPILHNLGTGRLRIDAPLVKKVVATAAAKPPVKQASATASGPLSRLEKLRLESRERARAAGEPAPHP